MTVELRPYQSKFIDDIRAQYASGRKSVLAVAPTGAGKTVCFSHMASVASSKRLRVGIMAHRTELLDQIGATLGKFGVEHGFIAPGRPANPFSFVQVCSVRSVAGKIERYLARPFDLLIVDEAHHAAAGSSWHQVISAHKGKHVLGVTATPQRLSGEPLADAFEVMVQGPTVGELMEIGALSKYRAFAPRSPDLHGIARRAGDYAKDQLDEAMDQPTITGDAVATYRKHATGKRAIAFCVSIAHAQHVSEMFRANGINSASLDGKMGRTERRTVLADFEAGRVLVLTSCEIVSEGFDLPAIEAAILLRPTQSLALHLQQVGRSLRPYPGKTHALILDHAGNLARHGLPDDEREWSLAGHAKKKGDAAISTARCPECFAVFSPRAACPECGHDMALKVNGEALEGRTVKEVAGEIEEIDVEALRLQRKREIGSARTVLDLARIAKEKGHKPGWIIHIMKARGQPVSMDEVMRAMRG